MENLLFGQAEADSHFYDGVRFTGLKFTGVGKGMAMKSLYLLIGSEAALAERALAKIVAELKEEKCEITTISSPDALVGDISDALAPSLFSERRALIIKDLQDLPEESRDEIIRYLPAPDELTTLVFLHKGGVKGKALLDLIKKAKPEIIACDPLKKKPIRKSL